MGPGCGEDDGDNIAWSWHHFNGSSSGESATYDTSASSTNGIAAVRVQAGAFEGNTLETICSSTLKYNPYN
ncbi:hypothetical protein ACFWP5_24570 [Streptomyces sp. NPDC058469]|uniref:hypothetical protein n=1 Tax=Streptomyces sp. NPDC058469 TaxID=3346514 RepID=UPI003646BB27